MCQNLINDLIYRLEHPATSEEASSWMREITPWSLSTDSANAQCSALNIGIIALCWEICHIVLVYFTSAGVLIALEASVQCLMLQWLTCSV